MGCRSSKVGIKEIVRRSVIEAGAKYTNPGTNSESHRFSTLFNEEEKPKRTQWKRGRQIGVGSFGTVYLGLKVSTGAFFAIKEIPIRLANKQEITELKSEIKVMSQLRHKHIVRYLGSEIVSNENGEVLCIFSEWMARGSLVDIVEKFGRLHPNVVANYTYQILRGLKYLHKRGVIHRDIKGANMLVDEHGVVKLADFGAAKFLGRINAMTESLKGTPYFMAPEVIKCQGYSISADIWSLGCTVLQLISGMPAWKAMRFNNVSDLLNHIMTTDQSPPMPDDLPLDLASFLSRCFDRDPEKRSGCKQLLQHPFITGRVMSCNRAGILRALGEGPKAMTSTSSSDSSSQSDSGSEDLIIGPGGKKIAKRNKHRLQSSGDIYNTDSSITNSKSRHGHRSKFSNGSGNTTEDYEERRAKIKKRIKKETAKLRARGRRSGSAAPTLSNGTAPTITNNSKGSSRSRSKRSGKSQHHHQQHHQQHQHHNRKHHKMSNSPKLKAMGGNKVGKDLAGIRRSISAIVDHSPKVDHFNIGNISEVDVVRSGQIIASKQHHSHRKSSTPKANHHKGNNTSNNDHPLLTSRSSNPMPAVLSPPASERRISVSKRGKAEYDDNCYPQIGGSENYQSMYNFKAKGITPNNDSVSAEINNTNNSTSSSSSRRRSSLNRSQSMFDVINSAEKKARITTNDSNPPSLGLAPMSERMMLHELGPITEQTAENDYLLSTDAAKFAIADLVKAATINEEDEKEHQRPQLIISSPKRHREDNNPPTVLSPQLDARQMVIADNTMQVEIPVRDEEATFNIRPSPIKLGNNNNSNNSIIDSNGVASPCSSNPSEHSRRPRISERLTAKSKLLPSLQMPQAPPAANGLPRQSSSHSPSFSGSYSQFNQLCVQQKRMALTPQARLSTISSQSGTSVIMTENGSSIATSNDSPFNNNGELTKLKARNAYTPENLNHQINPMNPPDKIDRWS
eukprot:TRINITY_DN5403_c0_g1_i1.p1 TRINITY_DN5403_c0_g1~~TRINITY_DN5403_c0_g1_i1.p1  ORF type:complete len:964 (+),score=256.22 TRINITY_DN5403_c0_g1_i1:214-3105(+)